MTNPISTFFGAWKIADATERAQRITSAVAPNVKYDDPQTPQWPSEDREMALNIDSHDFALRISKEGDFFVSRPEQIT